MLAWYSCSTPPFERESNMLPFTSAFLREVVGSKFELPASYDWTRLDEYAPGATVTKNGGKKRRDVGEKNLVL